MNALPYSEACERNKDPILDVLRVAFAGVQSVLEIGSGTAQHAVYFAQHLPHLTWFTSDLPENIASIQARIQSDGADNVRPPLILDVQEKTWAIPQVDAVYTANTLHIMSWPRVVDLFQGLGRVLHIGGSCCIYGPFNYKGDYTSPSNAQFDVWLKQRDSESGIRDFEAVDDLAAKQGLELVHDHAMPANNRLLLWVKNQ